MSRIVTLFLIFSTFICFGQQEPHYTQYMYNTITINPAYAGTRDVLSVFGLHRTQWVNLDGAPETTCFSVNSPLNTRGLGIGVSVTNDKIGPTNDNTFALDLSYTIATSKKYKLSFGLKGSLNRLDINVTKLNPFQLNDPEFKNLDGTFRPNIGVGIYFHSPTSYYGFSIPNSIEIIRLDNESASLYKAKRNCYFIAGQVFKLSDSFQLKPSFVSKYTEGAPVQLDISGTILYQERFLLGCTARINAAISGLLGYQITDSWFVGYGYDLDTTSLSNFNSGSHELFVRYELFKNYSKIVSPRFF